MGRRLEDAEVIAGLPERRGRHGAEVGLAPARIRNVQVQLLWCVSGRRRGLVPGVASTALSAGVLGHREGLGLGLGLGLE